MEKVTALKGGWQVVLDPSDACGSFVLGREDGKFFRIVFNSAKYGQPVIEEVEDDEGWAGYVIPIVKKIDGVWNVVVTYNDRPANDYAEKLLEGARRSASNQSPFITTDGEEVISLPGYLFTNSARIAGKVRVGVVDVTEVDQFDLAAGAEYMPFEQFFDQSTDALTKAALGHFIVKQIGI